MKHLRANRLFDWPIIHPGLASALGANINGPSLIRAPEWLNAPARYLLYFAHHEGRSIRLALADDLSGPWRIHEGGVLRLEQTPLPQIRPSVPQPDWARRLGVDGLYPHIASPDVLISPEARRLEMLFHGLDHDGSQISLRATSIDGLEWQLDPAFRCETVYLRSFHYQGQRYAIGLAGQLLRETAREGLETGPKILGTRHRHPAVLVIGDTALVISSRIGDAPEALISSIIDLREDWREWRARAWKLLLTPERPWEGVDRPITSSRVGTAQQSEHALRDPAFFCEDGKAYLLYSVAGEQGIAIAELSGI